MYLILLQGYDLAKRLLGVGVIWPKDSFVLIKPWHQGVIWPDHPNTKESFGQITPQNFKGHFPKIKKNTKESFVQITVALHEVNFRNALLLRSLLYCSEVGLINKFHLSY